MSLSRLEWMQLILGQIYVAQKKTYTLASALAVSHRLGCYVEIQIIFGTVYISVQLYMYLFGTVYLVDHFAGSTIVVLGCTRGVGINYTHIVPILILLIAIYFGILEFLYYGLTYCKLVQPLWRR